MSFCKGKHRFCAAGGPKSVSEVENPGKSEETCKTTSLPPYLVPDCVKEGGQTRGIALIESKDHSKKSRMSLGNVQGFISTVGYNQKGAESISSLKNNDD